MANNTPSDLAGWPPQADLCPDRERDGLKARIEAVAAGVSVHVVSAVTGEGLDGLRASFASGQTPALLGSSGAGKSSLMNALAGAPVMATRPIREHDARGRHTTTHRQVVLLSDGRLILDTPGMRELGLREADAGVAATFAEVEALARHCRFNDCAHAAEPGCDVQAALADGRLDRGRWRSYLKLQREAARAARKDDPREHAEARKVWVQRTSAVERTSGSGRRTIDADIGARAAPRPSGGELRQFISAK